MWGKHRSKSQRGLEASWLAVLYQKKSKKVFFQKKCFSPQNLFFHHTNIIQKTKAFFDKNTFLSVLGPPYTNKSLLCSCIFRKSNLFFFGFLVEKGKNSALHQQNYVQKSTFSFFSPFWGSKKDEFTTQKVFPNTNSKKVFFDGGI